MRSGTMGRDEKAAMLVIWAGRHRRDVWADLSDRYIKRIQPMASLRESAVRVGGRGEGRARLEAEGRSILGAVPERAYLAVLDSRGRQRASETLAGWLRRRLEGARRPLVFVVGSDLGVAPSVVERADETISFGRGTLPHELARIVLLEQLYRSLSILKGMKYHRQPL